MCSEASLAERERERENTDMCADKNITIAGNNRKPADRAKENRERARGARHGSQRWEINFFSLVHYHARAHTKEKEAAEIRGVSISSVSLSTVSLFMNGYV